MHVEMGWLCTPDIYRRLVKSVENSKYFKLKIKICHRPGRSFRYYFILNIVRLKMLINLSIFLSYLKNENTVSH